MADQATTTAEALSTGTWRLDPTQSSIEFSVPHFYGLIKIRGHFNAFAAELQLDSEPAVRLTVEAESIDTGNAKRDKHLRSKDFFTVSEHPTISFTSTRATLSGSRLDVSGTIEALGNRVPIEIPLRVVPAGDGFEVDGTVLVDQRKLGLSWSPLGITRTPTAIKVRGRLVR